MIKKSQGKLISNNWQKIMEKAQEKDLENKEKIRYSLEFKIEPEMDMEVVKAFVFAGKERTLEWGIFKYYPQLREYITKNEDGKFTITNKQVIKDIIDNFYKEDRDKIEEGMINNKNKWLEKEEKFNDLVLDLFGDKDILSDKYKAYNTMWSMFPRFIEGGYFSIPGITKANVNFIIADELINDILQEVKTKNLV